MDTKALRQKILDLAIRGKLVPQDPNDEPASVLLERIREQKKQMVKEGKLKAKDIKNDTIIFVGEDNLHYEKFTDGTVKCIEDEIPFELPEGWEWCRLNHIYNFIDYRGATPTKITNGIPLITAKNVKSGYIDYTVDDYISEEEFNERQQRGVSKKGDILFTTEAPLGNAALADIEKFSAGQRLITFQHYGSKNELINYVMLMFILSEFFQQQLYVNKTGSTVAGIKAAILKTLWIPVPPYNEQLRISNTLKSAINLVESISENKEVLSLIISNAKSKILDLSIRGKLVPQDPNDEPASVLLERIRAEKEELIKQGKIKRDKKESIIFRGDDNSYYEKIGDDIRCIDDEIPFEIPDTWEWLRLENCCCKEIRRGKSPKYIEQSETLVFAQKCNTKYNGIDIGLAFYLDESTLNKYPEDEYMQDGDIVINSTGTGTLGRVGFYRATNNRQSVPIVPDSHVTVIRSYQELNAFYLYAFMKANQSELEKKGEGSTNQKELKPLTLKELYVPVPPYEEQLRIAVSINNAFSLISKLEKSLK
ncbi:restriction endonuclease subunit S [bacterium]|nr:restriction endonuclease subunit S [bacterium]